MSSYISILKHFFISSNLNLKYLFSSLLFLPIHQKFDIKESSTNYYKEINNNN